MSIGSASRVVRVFVSSTFLDFQVERDALQREVFPKLREHCAAEGYSFQAIDLRWGVTEPEGENYETLDICLQEIRHCQALSPKPNFIALLGDRYGWCPLPRTIPAEEFRSIVAALSKRVDDLDLLYNWYRLDKNAIPPVYCLLPSGDLRPATVEIRKPEHAADADSLTDGRPAAEARLRGLFREGAFLAELPHDRMQHYTYSATAHEIQHGVIAAPNAQEHAFCCIRELTNLEDLVAPDGTMVQGANAFVDIDANGHLDRDASRRLRALKDNLGLSASHVKRYAARWTGKGISTDHVAALCADILTALTNVIDERIREDEQVDSLARETIIHEATHRYHVDSVVDRGELVQRVIRYLTAADSTEETALLVFSYDNSSSSAVMARSIETLRAARPDTIVVFRYLGASLASSDRDQLFSSLDQQIRRAYGATTNETANETTQRRSLLVNTLALATAEHPLVVFLDGLEDLSDFDPFRDAPWLGQLPAHTRVVASVAEGSESFAPLVRLVATDHLLSVPLVEREEALELVVRLLAKRRRRLQPEQQQVIAATLPERNAEVSLQLLSDRLQSLKSFEMPEASVDAQQSQLLSLLEHLSREDQHGEPLVRRALGYLAAARRGLSEEELFDLVSHDVEVIDDFSRRSPRSPPVGQLPFIAWARLSSELEGQLRTVSHDGIPLLGFANEQMRRIVRELYVEKDGGEELYRGLSAYFDRQPLFRKGMDHWYGIPGIDEAFTLGLLENMHRQGDRAAISTIANVRKVVELPEALLQIEAYDDLVALLSDRNFVEVYMIVESLDGLFALWKHVDDKQPGVVLEAYAETLRKPESYDSTWVGTIAMTLRWCGHNQDALHLQEYLEGVHRRSGADQALAANLLNQGGLYNRMENYDAALEKYAAAEDIARRLGQSEIVASALMNKAITLELQGHYDLAERAYREAEELFQAQGNAFGLAQIRQNLSVFLTKVGQISEAQSYMSRSLDAYEESAGKEPYMLTTRPVGSSRWQRARLMLEDAAQYLDRGDARRAIDVLRKAEVLGFGAADTVTTLKAQFLQREVALLDEHARSLIAEGNRDAAVLVLEHLASLHEALGDSRLRLMALSACGLLLLEAGDVESGRVALEIVRNLAERLGFEDIQKEVESALSDLRWRR